jgi:hypothetical protein
MIDIVVPLPSSCWSRLTFLRPVRGLSDFLKNFTQLFWEGHLIVSRNHTTTLGVYTFSTKFCEDRNNRSGLSFSLDISLALCVGKQVQRRDLISLTDQASANP